MKTVDGRANGFYSLLNNKVSIGNGDRRTRRWAGRHLDDPSNPPNVVACRRWVADLQTAGWQVILPEIADYEVRRELLLRGSSTGIAHLDWLCGQLEYLPLTTAAMRQAAEFWAMVRKAGMPTAGPGELDADAILAAQAVTLGDPGVVIATANVGHLTRLVAAELWENIVP